MGHGLANMKITFETKVDNVNVQRLKNLKNQYLNFNIDSVSCSENLYIIFQPELINRHK